MDFLSVNLLEEGLLPTEEGPKKIMDWPRLGKPKDVAAFPGFIQYYAQFLPSQSSACP